MTPLDLMHSKLALIWDFDGVIKESVDVKTRAYCELFATSDPVLRSRIKAHHQQYGGVSRFDKVPLYLGWSGLPKTQENIAAYCDAFGRRVKDAVIASEWVPGVYDYLANHHMRQSMFIVTATPQKEIEEIIALLGIGSWFRDVIGAPTEKSHGARRSLNLVGCASQEALMIGDSESDYRAANAAEVPFLLRVTQDNSAFRRKYPGPYIQDFQHG